MRPQVNVFANGLFMAHSPQKCLADMNIVRRWIAVAVSTLPGIPAQHARYLSEYFLVFHCSGAGDGQYRSYSGQVGFREIATNLLEARFWAGGLESRITRGEK